MHTASRLRRSRLASAAAIVGATLLLAPPPAAADRDDWEEDWHEDSYRPHARHSKKHHHGHGHRHRHGEWCPPRHAQPYAYVPYGYRGYGYRPPARPARYYCEPCDHWYYDQPSFHQHVHHHHHVPRGVLPLVILATVFGAVFSGH